MSACASWLTTSTTAASGGSLRGLDEAGLVCDFCRRSNRKRSRSTSTLRPVALSLQGIRLETSRNSARRDRSLQQLRGKRACEMKGPWSSNPASSSSSVFPSALDPCALISSGLTQARRRARRNEVRPVSTAKTGGVCEVGIAFAAGIGRAALSCLSRNALDRGREQSREVRPAPPVDLLRDMRRRRALTAAYARARGAL